MGEGGEGNETVRRLVIRGRVQGVGYRAWMTAEARKRGLSGWVRNRPDGSVEAVAAGSPPEIEALAAACRTGPSGARVDSVEQAPAAGETGFSGFSQRPTG